MIEEFKKLNAHLWARHEHDWYVEPNWVSERLFQVEPFVGGIVDPACGSGRIVRSALGHQLDARGFDIVNRCPGVCSGIRNFLEPMEGWYGNIVSNPPFKHAEEFARLSLERASMKVALLLPSKWIHGDKRARWLATTPLRKVLFITPRPSMPPGPVIEAGIDPGGGKADFAWFIWLRGFDGKPEAGWLRRDA